MNNVVILALKRIIEITNPAWPGTLCVEGSLLVIICPMLSIEPQPALYHWAVHRVPFEFQNVFLSAWDQQQSMVLK